LSTILSFDDLSFDDLSIDVDDLSTDFETGEMVGGLGRSIGSQIPPPTPPSSSRPSQFSALWIAI
jgi:hypothetical protein